MIPPYVQRMVEEGDNLAALLSRLSAFIESPRFATLDPVDQSLMMAQCGHMGNYLEVLLIRTQRAFAAIPATDQDDKPA